jgi:predicted glutamine amidotransferase
MCKVMGMAGINDKNRKQALTIMKMMTDKMVKSERDGFGYAAIDRDGFVYGEKWTNVNEAMKKRPSWVKHNKVETEELNQSVLSQFGELVDNKYSHVNVDDLILQDDNYCKFGQGSLKDAVAIIAHSRFATVSAKTINEVHPFYHHNDNIALIHNGIIKNHTASYFEKIYSDCDSEVILHQYAENLVNLDSRAIGEAVRDLEGYFACLTLAQAQAKDQSFYPAMDIFKGDAFLDVVYIQELNLNVFCTRGDIVTSICRELKLKCSKAFPVKDLNLIRINAITGEITERQGFYWTNKSKGFNGSIEDESLFYKSKYGADASMDSIADVLEPRYRESKVYNSNYKPYGEQSEVNEMILEQLNYKVNKG